MKIPSMVTAVACSLMLMLTVGSAFAQQSSSPVPSASAKTGQPTVVPVPPKQVCTGAKLVRTRAVFVTRNYHPTYRANALKVLKRMSVAKQAALFTRTKTVCR